MAESQVSALDVPVKEGPVACWGSVQITKINWLHSPELPKDLSLSNVVTVEVLRRTLVDRTRGLRSHSSIGDEDDVADLKVVKILEQRLRCRTSGTSAY
jgi:hypothetical protein